MCLRRRKALSTTPVCKRTNEVPKRSEKVSDLFMSMDLRPFKFERAEQTTLEGVAETETRREEVVFRFVHKIVANVGE